MKIPAGQTVWVDRFGKFFLAAQEAKIGGKPYEFVYDRLRFNSWMTHVIESGERERFWSTIAPGDVVMDVGASHGSYTLPALAQGAAHVYALSPSAPGKIDSCTEILLSSLDQNEWRGRCSILPFGLYSATGWLVTKDFAPPSEFFGADVTPDALPPEAFPVTTLDRLDAEVLHLERLDWIKIDVEGAEVHVLEGGLETIRRFKPRILVENHLFKDPAIEGLVAEILKQAGYAAAGRSEDGTVSHTFWLPPAASVAVRVEPSPALVAAVGRS